MMGNNGARNILIKRGPSFWLKALDEAAGSIHPQVQTIEKINPSLSGGFAVRGVLRAVIIKYAVFLR